ncbi:hypothetical protein E2562_023408 [Oryza meyeriana var. granulata]|uniref:WRKY domain-containing protein n=1 Tax=Oryza meyeriana var. granulata TaxID=110450 RepID=A0A6G1E0W5_9ORYZ|nr:hypothetical protein E2562_023408 [Oryza meyeriana var. granulata]
MLNPLKSTNQLKALLAQGGAGSRVDSSGAVEAVLSDISDSLSQALASLLLGAFDDRLLPAAPPEASLSSYGQCVVNSGRRSVSKRKGWMPHLVELYYSVDIVMIPIPGGSTGRRTFLVPDLQGTTRSGCSARKQVQQSDDDPSRLEITYIGAHTYDDRPHWLSSPSTTRGGTPSVTVISLRLPQCRQLCRSWRNISRHLS